MGTAPDLPPEILAYYGLGEEAERLERSGHGPLERDRTREILLRHLPPAPATVLDVGGGPGGYAVWLAERGYRVHLIDPVPLHLELAARASAGATRPLGGIRSGDARALDEADRSVDAVLLLGPLYHLTERAGRLAALAEAARVLRPGGVLLAAAVCRFASLLDGLVREILAQPDYRAIVEQDLRDGQHRSPGNPDWFTTAFFHHPDELAEEVRAAGLGVEALLAIEGPAWLLLDLPARWSDPGRRAAVLAAVRAVEAEPSLLGASPHLMVVARAVARV